MLELAYATDLCTSNLSCVGAPRCSWYPTLCTLAGVDPSDSVIYNGTVRPIDGLDAWPVAPASLRQPVAAYAPWCLCGQYIGYCAIRS